jgi:hypothetical protein
MEGSGGAAFFLIDSGGGYGLKPISYYAQKRQLFIVGVCKSENAGQIP